jgi:membrane-bound ClpP family serine protease
VAKEVWSAVSDREGEEIKAGAKVNVVSLDGLTLRVAKTKEGEDDSVLENSQPV